VGHDYWIKRVKQLGKAIIKSTYLRVLEISILMTRMSPADFISLCRAVSHNRSIEHLKLDPRSLLSDVDIFPSLGLFVELNHNLRCLDISHAKNLSEQIPSLILNALLSSHRLQRIVLWHNGIEDEHAADILNALHYSPGMHYLSDLYLGCNNIEEKGCTALVHLLKNPASKLRRLNLCCNNLNNTCVKILAGALMENSTLHLLKLSDQKSVSPSGWCSFAAVLLNPNFSLKTVVLSHNNVGDCGAISFGHSLTNNSRSKRKGFKLDLSYDKGISLVGWQGFSSCLCAPNSTLREINDELATLIITAVAKSSILKKLNMSAMVTISAAGWIQCFRLMADFEFTLDTIDLGHNTIDDSGATMLFNLLVNSSLKTLDIAYTESITPAGWMICLQSLIGTNTTVEKLELHSNNIDDEGAALLVHLPPTLCTTYIDLHDNRLISANGWSLFARILRVGSSSKLNQLCLGSEDQVVITDRVITGFADHALSQNISLEILELYGTSFSKRGWRALADSLCDNSSIADICNSNHTLHTFWLNHGVPPGCFSSCLSLNNNEDKADVIRSKILPHFFHNADNIGPIFAQLPTNLFPDAVSWIG
jgi:Ran GTPase-activating protein (RanGAP) involved in mRNA processing and transport